MREPGFQPISHAGSLLIAHPGLLDPNFHRTVLFLSQNDATEGAFGLVLNRPSGRLVSDLLPDRHDLGALGNLPVYLGGPVSRDQLIFVAFEWDVQSSALECRHHVSLQEALELLHHERAVVRPFIGYAGWSKGQLENELAQQAWLLKKPEHNVLDVERLGSLWRDLIRTFGPKYALIADAPEDLSLN